MNRKRKIETIRELVNERQPDCSGLTPEEREELHKRGLYPVSNIKSREAFVVCAGDQEADYINGLLKKAGYKKDIRMVVMVEPEEKPTNNEQA